MVTNVTTQLVTQYKEVTINCNLKLLLYLFNDICNFGQQILTQLSQQWDTKRQIVLSIYLHLSLFFFNAKDLIKK